MDAWELLETEQRHGGHLPVEIRRYRSSSGAIHTIDVAVSGPVVCILALTPEGQAVLVRQFRAGSGRVMTELPAGFIDEGESPAAAAARELAEETGYGGTLREVGQLSPHGYLVELRHVFVCTDARLTQPPRPGTGEELEVVTLGLERLRELLLEGAMTVTDACYLALDRLGLLCPA